MSRLDDATEPGHRTWASQTQEITSRAIELIQADLRSGNVLGIADALERVAADPIQARSHLQSPRPEREVISEVRSGDLRAVQMVQTDDWPPITMPGTGRPTQERQRTREGGGELGS